MCTSQYKITAATQEDVPNVDTFDPTVAPFSVMGLLF